MTREKPKPEGNEPADVVNVVFTIASIHAGCILPFIRSRFGSHAFAAYPLSALLMLFYAGCADCPLLAWYVIPWAVMVAVRRLSADPHQHSRYQGYPYVLGWMTNAFVARIAEPFICFFGAVFAALVSGPLSDFLLLEIVSLLIVLAIEQATLVGRKRDMRDRQIEAQRMSDMQRGGSGW